MNPDFVDAQILIKNGYSEKMAYGMKRHYRRAAAIVMGQLDGGTWNWDRMRWEDPSK